MIRFKQVDESPKAAFGPKAAAKPAPHEGAPDAVVETEKKAASKKAAPAARKRKSGKG